MEYSGSYRERIVLDDGAALELRVIRPSDKTALAEAFRRLSVQSRRQRFLSSKTDLSEEELRALGFDDEADAAWGRLSKRIVTVSKGWSEASAATWNVRPGQV